MSRLEWFINPFEPFVDCNYMKLNLTCTLDSYQTLSGIFNHWIWYLCLQLVLDSNFEVVSLWLSIFLKWKCIVSIHKPIAIRRRFFNCCFAVFYIYISQDNLYQSNIEIEKSYRSEIIRTNFIFVIFLNLSGKCFVYLKESWVLKASLSFSDFQKK